MDFSLILVIVVLLIVNNQSNKKVNKFTEFSRELHKKGKISDNEYEYLTGINSIGNQKQAPASDNIPPKVDPAVRCNS
jgi:hypothetical protein